MAEPNQSSRDNRSATHPHAAARNNAYRLTESGKELRPVLEALGKWSQTHLKTYHSDIVDII